MYSEKKRLLEETRDNWPLPSCPLKDANGKETVAGKLIRLEIERAVDFVKLWQRRANIFC